MPAPSLLHFGPYRLDGTRGQLWHHDAVCTYRRTGSALGIRPSGGADGAQDLARHRVGRHGGEGGVLRVYSDCVALGDAARQPRYIETVHRRGYRFVAEVTACAAAARAAPDGATVSPGPRGGAPAASPAPLGTDTRQGRLLRGGRARRCRAPVTGPLAPRAALPSAPLAGTEHRHLTVLSCTFGDGERLTPLLDPEDAYDLIQTLRATTLAIITAHAGGGAAQGRGGARVLWVPAGP